MTHPPEPPDDRPTSGSMSLIETLQALEGEEMPADQDAVLDAAEVEHGRRITRTELDGGYPDVPLDDVDDLGGLASGGIRDDETTDPGVAAQEGIPWIPPIDPPTVPSMDDDDPGIAAGTGLSALDEGYGPGEIGVGLPEGSELTERVREALRADAETSRFADRLIIGTIGSTAVVRGQVDDIDDSDSITAVALRVDGIEDVRDETEFVGL